MINQKRLESFLEKFGELERAIRKSDAFSFSSVLEFENGIDSGTVLLRSFSDSFLLKEKLKVCRIVRNYIQHNGSAFVEPSQEMISFLTDVVSDINKLDKKAKDVVVRMKPLLLSDTFVLAAEKLSRYSVFPVVDGKGKFLGLLDDEFVRKAVANKLATKKIKTMENKLKKCKFSKKDENVKGIFDICYLTKNDKPDGVFLGLVFA